jgi:hypothetical protein
LKIVKLSIANALTVYAGSGAEEQDLHTLMSILIFVYDFVNAKEMYVGVLQVFLKDNYRLFLLVVSFTLINLEAIIYTLWPCGE